MKSAKGLMRNFSVGVFVEIMPLLIQSFHFLNLDHLRSTNTPKLASSSYTERQTIWLEKVKKTFLLFLIFIIFGGGNITLKCVGRESALKIRKLMFQLFEPYTPSIPDEHKRVTCHMHLTLNRQLSVIYWRSFRFVFSAFWKRNWALYWNACLKPTKQNKTKRTAPLKTQPRTTFISVPYVGNKKGGKNLRWQQLYGNMNRYWPIWFTQGPRKSRTLVFAEIRLLVHPVVLWSSFHETFFSLSLLKQKRHWCINFVKEICSSCLNVADIWNKHFNKVQHANKN